MEKAGDSRIERETARAFAYFGDKLEEKLEEDDKTMKKEAEEKKDAKRARIGEHKGEDEVPQGREQKI